MFFVFPSFCYNLKGCYHEFEMYEKGEAGQILVRVAGGFNNFLWVSDTF
jgi:hypothetical protein